jgi:hypothetical protein
MTPSVSDSAALAMLADIELPAQPPDPAGALVLLAALVVLVAVIAGAWRMSRRGRRPGSRPVASEASPGRQALARLDALRESWKAGRVDDREAGFRICVLLRIGLGLAQLRSTAPPAGVDPAQWTHVVRGLEAVRYRPEQVRLTGRMFEQVQDWLAGSPATDRSAGG